MRTKNEHAEMMEEIQSYDSKIGESSTDIGAAGGMEKKAAINSYFLV